MSLVRQFGGMLDKAFPVALLLTGGVASAEKAVESVIQRSGPDCSAESFLAETVRSAVLQGKWRDELPLTVPTELRALSLLSPMVRNCFVLCALVGFDCRACSRILEVSVDDVKNALHRSFVDLPFAVQTVRRGRR
jgi:DNA-directed RNA polymerase specialized sigma24 family protein